MKNIEQIGKKTSMDTLAPKMPSIFFTTNARNGKHLGYCNIQCLNGTLYKKFVRKSTKLLGKYVEFTAQLRSLDGANAPSEAELTKLGFSYVNTALANTIEAVENISTKE